MNDKLDDIFANYEARKDRERKQSAKKEDAENQARAACQERLDRLILPTLETFVDKVNAAGYQGKIVERVKHHTHPRVVFIFKPKGSYLDSSLEFGCLDAGRVSVSYDLRLEGMSKSSVKNPSVSDPTPEWVEKNVLWLVEEVLKA